MVATTPRRGPISERYRPHRLDDIVGSPRARTELRSWAAEWNAGRVPARRAVVLAGPPGVGKTTTALALAEENGWSLVEMNASDARNERAIELVAGRASITHTLAVSVAGGPRARALILLDEADCLTGRRTETPRVAPPPVTLREFLRGRYGRDRGPERCLGTRLGWTPAAVLRMGRPPPHGGTSRLDPTGPGSARPF